MNRINWPWNYWGHGDLFLSTKPTNSVMNLRYFDRRVEEYTKNLSAYFVLNRSTGPVAHKVVAGADYIRFHTDKESAMFEARQRVVTSVSNGVVSQRVVPLQLDLNNPTYEIRDPSTYVRRPTPAFFLDYLNPIISGFFHFSFNCLRDALHYLLFQHLFPFFSNLSFLAWVFV